jgi:hypothetical protein
MADSWSVPIVGSVIDDQNDNIAKGADLSWIGNLANSYWKGQDQRYQQNQRNAFSNGLPKDAQGNVDWSQVSDTLAKVGGAGQVQNVIGLQNLGIARDALNKLGGSDVFSSGQPASTTAGIPPSPSQTMPNAVRVNPTSGQPQSPADVPTGTPAPPGQNITGPNTTVTGVDYGQAQQGGGNITPRMIASRTGGDPGQLANALGVSPDEVINTNDPTVRAKLAQVVRSGQPQQPSAQPTPQAQPQMQPQPQPSAQQFAQAAPQQAPQGMPQQASSIAAPSANTPQGNISEAQAQTFENRANQAFKLATGLSFSNPQAGQRLQAMGEQLMKQATTIREGLVKNSEVTPETKNYQQAVSQGYKGTQQQYQADVAAQTKEAETQVASLGKLADAGI